MEERTVLNIQIGDILTYDLVDYEIVGKLTYRDGSFQWYAYQLLGEQTTKWLAAEMDDELELGIYKTVKVPVTMPFPQQIQYDGKSYHKDEEGIAQVTGEGRSQNIKGSSTKYADYISEDEETYLSLEAWGTEVEVSYGYDVEEYEIKIIAGSK